MNISLLLVRFSLIFSPLLIVLAVLPVQAQADTVLPVVYPSAAKTAIAATTKKLIPPPFQQVSQPKHFTPSSQSINETMAEFTAANTLVQNLEVLEVYNNIFTAAYEAAPEIQVARKQQQQKSEELYTAWARRISPKVNAEFSQIREFNTTDDDSYTGETKTYSYEDGDEFADWSFDVDLPVYRRALGVQVNIAEAEQMLADNNLQIKTQELNIRLKNVLADYILSYYRLINIENSIQLSQQHVDRILRGYELRDQTRLQLLRAQANLKELEARRDLAVHDKEKAFRALLDFSGLSESMLAFKNLDKLMTDEISIAGCLNTLASVDDRYEDIEHFTNKMNAAQRQIFFKDNSLLYSQILLEKQLADQQATTFTQREYPDLAVRGYYDRLDDTQFTKFNGEGSLALVLSVPLFTGGTIFSTTKTQAIAQHIAEVNQYTDLRAQIHAIENNNQLITSLRSIYETQQINLRQQEEIVVLSVKSYQIKQTSMQDLLTSQNKLIDAKNALMQTTNRLAALYRQFAYELGSPFPLPQTAQSH